MKFYTSYLDDPEYLELERSARLRYWECYTLAWKADAAGDILNPDTRKPLTVKQIAMLLRDPLKIVTADLAALASADLLAQNGETWKVTRYCDEQTNQKEYREAAADRQAKSRENRKNVTSQSHVTDEHSKDKLSQEKLSHQSSESESELNISHQSSQASAKLDDDDDDGILILLDQWEETIPSEPISPALKRLLKQAKKDGIEDADLFEKMQETRFNADKKPIGYFTRCVQDLSPKEPTAATVNAAIEFLAVQAQVNGTGLTYDVLNAELKERGIKPVEPDQVRAFQAERETAPPNKKHI